MFSLWYDTIYKLKFCPLFSEKQNLKMSKIINGGLATDLSIMFYF